MIYASVKKLRNRRPQGSLPEGSPPDQSAPSTVPTFEQLRELTLNLDKAAPPSLDDNAYPYEAINCVQYLKQATFGQTRPWLRGSFFHHLVFFFSFFSFFPSFLCFSGSRQRTFISTYHLL